MRITNTIKEFQYSVQRNIFFQSELSIILEVFQYTIQINTNFTASTTKTFIIFIFNDAFEKNYNERKFSITSCFIHRTGSSFFKNATNNQVVSRNSFFIKESQNCILNLRRVNIIYDTTRENTHVVSSQFFKENFDAAIAPGPKDWDMNIQQFGITDERKQAVDFSSGYYKDTRAVIVKKDGKYANAKSLADLKDAVVGATVGTQGYTYAKEKINDDVQTFNDDASLAQALDAGQIDALVADTTVCVYMVQSGQVADGVVIGRIAGSEDKDGMGIVLPKDSPLTDAATKAVDDLEADGTLQKLQDQWLAEYTSDLPELA